jgi:transposase-like protein
MEITLKDILGLAKEIPEKYFEEIYEKLTEVKEKANEEKENKKEACLNCGGTAVVRNGKRGGRQAYICKDCGKTFLQNAKTAIAHSHSSETVWAQVIRDTVNGVSLDETADSLDLAHSTVFNMRHKILHAAEQSIIASPVVLEGVCETDETYILESVKGRKIPESYYRKPRKHGAVASKPGLSDEYICVQTSVTGTGKSVAVAVNRANPSKEEICQVFDEKIVEDTVILCDGNANYDVLSEKCQVAHSKRINKVNGFHSFIKERNRKYRGVATIYLNRYNALFSVVFANVESAVKEILDIMTSRNNSHFSISCIKSNNLLNV